MYIVCILGMLKGNKSSWTQRLRLIYIVVIAVRFDIVITAVTFYEWSNEVKIYLSSDNSPD